jgi:sporulation protein YlmC with PRC-barrel domain
MGFCFFARQLYYKPRRKKMKKASEVLNLKLMGIREGAEAGTVQDIMVNAATKA